MLEEVDRLTRLTDGLLTSRGGMRDGEARSTPSTSSRWRERSRRTSASSRRRRARRSRWRRRGPSWPASMPWSSGRPSRTSWTTRSTRPGEVAHHDLGRRAGGRPVDRRDRRGAGRACRASRARVRAVLPCRSGRSRGGVGLGAVDRQGQPWRRRRHARPCLETGAEHVPDPPAGRLEKPHERNSGHRSRRWRGDAAAVVGRIAALAISLFLAGLLGLFRPGAGRGLLCVIGVAARRHHDDPELAIPLAAANQTDQAIAVDLRHVQVDQGQAEPLDVEILQGLQPIAGDHRAQPDRGKARCRDSRADRGPRRRSGSARRHGLVLAFETYLTSETGIAVPWMPTGTGTSVWS